MNTKERLELYRGIVRPIMIGFLGITSFILVLANMIWLYDLTLFAEIWIGLFVFGGAEWIIERPIGKILSNISITKEGKG